MHMHSLQTGVLDITNIRGVTGILGHIEYVWQYITNISDISVTQTPRTSPIRKITDKDIVDIPDISDITVIPDIMNIPDIRDSPNIISIKEKYGFYRRHGHSSDQTKSDHRSRTYIYVPSFQPHNCISQKMSPFWELSMLKWMVEIVSRCTYVTDFQQLLFSRQSWHDAQRRRREVLY
jgi:hypothetical protein